MQPLGYPREADSFEKHIDIANALFDLYNILMDISSINTTNLAAIVAAYSGDSTIDDCIQDMQQTNILFKETSAYSTLRDMTDLQAKKGHERTKIKKQDDSQLNGICNLIIL